VPVTACGVVSVDAVSGVNRVFGSIPPGGTSGTAELDPAVEGAEAVVAAGAVGALGEHPLATSNSAIANPRMVGVNGIVIIVWLLLLRPQHHPSDRHES
jgi:hypothetical protein